MELMARDGRMVTAEVQLSRVRYPADGSACVLGVLRDISGRTLKEKDRDEQAVCKTLDHIVESMGMMADGIAHEIYNPLTVITGYSNMLLRQNLPPDMKADLGSIVTGAQRISNIVNKMLQFISRDGAEFMAVDSTILSMSASTTACMR